MNQVLQGMLKAAGPQGETAENVKRDEEEEESEEEMLQQAIALSLECHNQLDEAQTEEMATQKGVIWYQKKYG